LAVMSGSATALWTPSSKTAAESSKPVRERQRMGSILVQASRATAEMN